MEFTAGNYDEYDEENLPLERVKNPNGLLTAQMYRQAGDHITELAELQAEVQFTATVAQTAIQIAISETARADDLEIRLASQSAAYHKVSQAYERTVEDGIAKDATIDQQNLAMDVLATELLGTKMQLHREQTSRTQSEDKLKATNDHKLREANTALEEERTARIAAEQAAQSSALEVQSLQQTNTQLNEEIGPLRIQAAKVPGLEGSLTAANSELQRANGRNRASERVNHELRVLLGKTDPNYRPAGFLGRLKNQLTSLVQPQSK